MYLMTKNNQTAIESLHKLRRTLSASLPDSTAIPGFIEATLISLFPHFSREGQIDENMLEHYVDDSASFLNRLCRSVVPDKAKRLVIISDFIDYLPSLHATLLLDAEAIFRGDPAAKCVDEIIIAYPGFWATAVYRVANWLYQREIPIVPRMISEFAHRQTGIDIHPGAHIGKSFVIDHGTGIVVGETTIIGENVKIYQGVTLGALSVDKSLAHKRRHPTIERDVVIYANATILGGETIIGAGSVIGGNVWLTESVAPGTKVYHRA